ncbi:class I SAM-dependent methyltransferase [Streptomyces sp. NPDC051563]|uniref:class I SAM-dependent methyltransferase n=1 Tax=Streptomyces sp. NPDC051563 TaxID=3365659 RepID=UPI0037B43BB9
MKIESDELSAGTGGRTATYDRIGVGYRQIRRPDPRLAALIAGGLGDARTVVNVGAGAGSYEPEDREVTAVEPSRVMLDQHPGTRKVRAVAQELPFVDGAFDAAMAVMTVHHWPDPARGLAELRRVSRRQAVFTWDPAHATELWLFEEYLPEIGKADRSAFTPLSVVTGALDAHTVLPFPVPHDFTDGFRAAFWRRPESYLDPAVRGASSTLARRPASAVEPGIARLRADLRSGAWQRRHAGLLERESVDYGYRLVLAGS